MTQFNIKDCTLVAHAIDSGDFASLNHDSWNDFWKHYIGESSMKKCQQWNNDAVGSHVVDANGKFYITPRPNDENREMGMTKDVEAKGRVFLVPTEFLAPVSRFDSKPKSGKELNWKGFIEANKDLRDYLKSLDPQKFVDQCKKEYYK